MNQRTAILVLLLAVSLFAFHGPYSEQVLRFLTEGSWGSVQEERTMKVRLGYTSLPVRIDGATTLVAIKHFPGIKKIKLIYHVSWDPKQWQVEKDRQENALLGKNCNQKEVRKILNQGYVLNHVYRGRKGSGMLFEMNITRVKCFYRKYPGKDLDYWRGVFSSPSAGAGKTGFRSITPPAGKSKIITEH